MTFVIVREVYEATYSVPDPAGDKEISAMLEMIERHEAEPESLVFKQFVPNSMATRTRRDAIGYWIKELQEKWRKVL